MNKKIAVPVKEQCLCQHFGHCDQFAVVETDREKIIGETYLTPPPHEPGVFPAWLASEGVTHIIAGGMGQRAIALFNQNNIEVLTGAEAKPARQLVEEYIANTLKTGNNACDH